jgi:hypothetical protein
MIIIPKLKLGYQNIPKVATTSIFEWLYVAHEGKLGEGGGLPDKKGRMRDFFMRGKSGRAVENSSNGIADANGYYRFALTRDPIKRFLSMYSNRIVYHRELSERAKCAERLIALGLPFDPQPNELVERFFSYLKVAKVIEHHARPQMDFLGQDMSVYTRIADISSVGEVVSEIRAFWIREGLVEICEHTPAEPGRKQTGGPKLALNVLTPDSFEKLLEYYSEDYEKLPTVSLQAIKDEYVKARAAGDAEPVIFPPLRKERIGRLTKSSTGQSARKQVRVEKEECALTDLVRLNLPDDMEIGKPFVLKGAVVLAGGRRQDWRLAVENGDGVREMEWGLPSPGLSERFQDNPDAGTSRFKLAEVRLDSAAPVRLWLESADKERHLLASILA